VAQLIYYGDVLNNSNEHWQSAKISLSTGNVAMIIIVVVVCFYSKSVWFSIAEPQEGGEPPKMSTLTVRFAI
jgi:hypothetical protein